VTGGLPYGKPTSKNDNPLSHKPVNTVQDIHQKKIDNPNTTLSNADGPPQKYYPTQATNTSSTSTSNSNTNRHVNILHKLVNDAANINANRNYAYQNSQRMNEADLIPNSNKDLSKKNNFSYYYDPDKSRVSNTPISVDKFLEVNGDGASSDGFDRDRAKSYTSGVSPFGGWGVGGGRVGGGLLAETSVLLENQNFLRKNEDNGVNPLKNDPFQMVKKSGKVPEYALSLKSENTVISRGVGYGPSSAKHVYGHGENIQGGIHERRGSNNVVYSIQNSKGVSVRSNLAKPEKNSMSHCSINHHTDHSTTPLGGGHKDFSKKENLHNYRPPTAIITPQADKSSKSFNQMLLNGQAVHGDRYPNKKMSRDTRSGMSSVSNLSPPTTREKSHTFSYNMNSGKKKNPPKSGTAKPISNPGKSNSILGNPNGPNNGKNSRPSYENIIEKHESFEKNYPRTITQGGATNGQNMVGKYAVRSEYNISTAGQKHGGSISYQQITLADNNGNNKK
jgi:hypothetical protein